MVSCELIQRAIYCNYRAGIQGVTLCEENPDGRVDCTGTAIMTSNEGHAVALYYIF